MPGPLVDGPQRVPPGTPVPQDAPADTNYMEYVFKDREGRILMPVKAGPGGRPLPSGAPPEAFTYEPLWLNEEGEVVGERPPALVRRNEIGVPGKKFKGRTVDGPQRVKRDRTYREMLAPSQPKQSFKRTDLMVDFTGNVVADEVFYQFLSPAWGNMDKFVISAPEGALISIKSSQKDSGPSITQEFGPIGTIVFLSNDVVELQEGGRLEMWSNVSGFVSISCILHSTST